jgi:hypothetical protein
MRSNIDAVRPWLVRIIAGLLLVRALWAAFGYAWTLPPQYWLVEWNGDQVAEADQRLGRVRVAMNQHEPINYLSDRQSGKNYTPVEVAQYALAPILVDTHRARHIVVADFTSDAALDEVTRSGEYRLMQRFAAGLAVLERTAR